MSTVHSCSLPSAFRSAATFGNASSRTNRSIATAKVGRASIPRPSHSRRPALTVSIEVMFAIPFPDPTRQRSGVMNNRHETVSARGAWIRRQNGLRRPGVEQRQQRRYRRPVAERCSRAGPARLYRAGSAARRTAGFGYRRVVVMPTRSHLGGTGGKGRSRIAVVQHRHGRLLLLLRGAVRARAVSRTTALSREAATHEGNGLGFRRRRAVLPVRDSRCVAALASRDERPTRRRGAGSAVGFVAVLVLLGVPAG